MYFLRSVFKDYTIFLFKKMVGPRSKKKKKKRKKLQKKHKKFFLSKDLNCGCHLLLSKIFLFWTPTYFANLSLPILKPTLKIWRQFRAM